MSWTWASGTWPWSWPWTLSWTWAWVENDMCRQRLRNHVGSSCAGCANYFPQKILWRLCSRFRADTCRECVQVGLPVPKVSMKTKTRPCFTSAGADVSTHSQIYSAVPKRSLESLPRMYRPEKQEMIGCGEIEELADDFAEAASSGHALF